MKGCEILPQKAEINEQKKIIIGCHNQNISLTQELNNLLLHNTEINAQNYYIVTQNKNLQNEINLINTNNGK